MDAASIEVSRRLRHVRTDRLYVERLLVKLIRDHTGERGGWRAVKVVDSGRYPLEHMHTHAFRLEQAEEAIVP